MTWKDLYNKDNTYEIEKDFYSEIRDYIANDLKLKIDICMKLKGYKEVLILGVGTSHSEWVNFDTFGPRVGSLLRKYNLPQNITCYGNMESSLNATNIYTFVKEMKKELEQKMVIAIDSSMSRKRNLGQLTIYNQGLKPGSAVGKKLPVVGDISILGNTVEKTYNLFELSKDQIDKLSISTDKLEELVNITAESICLAFSKENSETCKQLIKK